LVNADEIVAYVNFMETDPDDPGYLRAYVKYIQAAKAAAMRSSPRKVCFEVPKKPLPLVLPAWMLL